MLVLGIETSCDETSCAVVDSGTKVLSNVISSSLKFHKKYGGVIPEIASRAHLETITPVAKEALFEAKIKLEDVDLIAVTKEPGLIGSLLVGVTFAKSLGLALGKPVVEINHVLAHLYAAWLDGKKPEFPLIGLVVSGGHTNLYLVESFTRYNLIGKTLDDAAGEAFDKAAKILGLGYPGGPIIDKLSQSGDKERIKFSCEGPRDSFDFSFSGIKTALLYKTNDKNFRKKYKLVEIAASYQAAIIETIARKTFSALEKYRLKHLVVGGGVTANSYLRKLFTNLAKQHKINLYLSEIQLCTDNAAIIAGLGYRLKGKALSVN